MNIYGGYLIALGALREEPMNPSNISSPGPLSQAIVESLEERWKHFRKCLRTLRTKTTVGAVHHGRTACRRLLATLAVTEPLIGRKHVRGSKKILRRLLGSLGPLRDVQVELESTHRFKTSASRISGFRSHLNKKEKALGRQAAREARKLRVKRMRKGIQTLSGRLHKIDGSPQAQSKAARRLLARVDEAFSAALMERKALDPTDVATLHRVRVALKKYRYIVEALQPVLHGVDTKHLDTLSDLQDRMGDLHDHQVLSGAFQVFIRKHRKDRFPNRLLHQKRLLERHNETAERVSESADRILKYWQHWTARGPGRLRSEVKALAE